MDYSDSLQPCSFLRRIAAIFYDSILLFAVLFLATALLLPFTHGVAIKSGNFFYLGYLILISYIYFAWQWMCGGQTLGMRAWHIRLHDPNKQSVNTFTVSTRFCLALVSWLIAGLGFVWAIFDKEKLALHDRFSGTRLFVEEEKKLNHVIEKRE